MEYSIISRSIEKEILPTLRELGIGVNPYGVLSRGLLSGHWQQPKDNDFRSHLPRFIGDNAVQNLKLVAALEKIAAEKNATPAQIAIAWVLHQGHDVIPLVGARKVNRLEESLKALDISLSDADLSHIERDIPTDAVAGTRYDAGQMQMLDSETHGTQGNH